MTVLIEIKNATKQYGSQILLNDTGATIHDYQKIGFIGRNGAGKSTLCKILLEKDELDSGSIIYFPQLRLGYLQQHDPFLPDETVIGFLMRDSEQPDWKCGEVAAEFEIKGEMLDNEVKSLSGGWQTRVKLASLLLHNPNFLILDEPTNFLDLRTQILLQHFLTSFRGAFLVVSHDRGFLKATCQQTLEISRGKLTFFAGDVEKFLLNKEEKKVHDERFNAAVESKRKHLETFIAKNRANASTASQARSKARQLEKLQTVDIETDEKKVNLRLPAVEPRRGTAFKSEGLVIGYPDKTVARDVSIEIEHQSRIAIVGDNGQGKTTFLRTITESIPILGGKFKWGYGCKIGVYAQHVYTSLPEDWTVQQYLESEADTYVTTQQVLDLAGSFLFQGPLIKKPIKVLSGGERARLCMCGLLLSGCNVLILDEPGNHLDVETVDALIDAFLEFEGTIIFSSHDRYFMERVTTHVIEVRDERVISYPADFLNYQYRVQKEVEENLRVIHADQKAKAKNNTSRSKETNATSDADSTVSSQERLKQIEKELASLNSRTEEINGSFNTYADDLDKMQELQDELMSVFEKISELEEEWLHHSDLSQQ